MNSESSLEMVSPGSGSRRIGLAPRLEFGRESGDVIVADPAVSRRHLLLEVTEEAWYASDLGSSNGTVVNGKRIDGRIMLSPGDEIRIGDTRITVGDAPEPREPSKPPAPAPSETVRLDAPPAPTPPIDPRIHSA